MACLVRQAKAHCVSEPEQARRILVAVLNSPGGLSSLAGVALAAEPSSHFSVDRPRIG